VVQPVGQRADLGGGDPAEVLTRRHPVGIDRGGPRVAVEAELGDPGVAPAGHDRLAGRVPGRRVVEAAARRAFRVAAGPGAGVHREHRGGHLGRPRGQQLGDPVGVDLADGQRGVHAAPAPPVDRRQAQVRQRGHRLGRQQPVDQLEQRVPAPSQTAERFLAEAPKPHRGQALVHPSGPAHTVHRGHRRCFEASQLRRIQRWPPSCQLPNHTGATARRHGVKRQAQNVSGNWGPSAWAGGLLVGR
jgi:hypothetical protein